MTDGEDRGHRPGPRAAARAAHPLHGSTDGHDFRCPDASADKDGDGIVSTAEGLPQYGDVNISPTTKGDTSKDSGLGVDRMPVDADDGKSEWDPQLPQEATAPADCGMVKGAAVGSICRWADGGFGREPARLIP
ncbi:hypothetical protein [Streptomyces niveus]|uniref:hypothetical protein n=1 Tax=Streptomyces niveus TaxID=193462 RepID=UPI0003C5B872|nr:hypothetical protein M877_19060 [Streptomyces niveus NCIMB 11891]